MLLIVVGFACKEYVSSGTVTENRFSGHKFREDGSKEPNKSMDVFHFSIRNQALFILWAYDACISLFSCGLSHL